MANSVTNVSNRSIIKNSTQSIDSLSKRFNTSKNTINKWKNRTDLNDKSSAPINIEYALNQTQRTLIKTIRTTTWLPLDEILEMVSTNDDTISRSAIYRLFLKEEINQVPQEKKQRLSRLMSQDICTWM